jgi:hypothetical protein
MKIKIFDFFVYFFDTGMILTRIPLKSKIRNRNIIFAYVLFLPMHGIREKIALNVNNQHVEIMLFFNVESGFNVLR